LCRVPTLDGCETGTYTPSLPSHASVTIEGRTRDAPPTEQAASDGPRRVPEGKGSDAKETNRPRGPRTRTQPYPTTVEALPDTRDTSRPLPLRVMGCSIHRSTFVSIGTDPSLLNPRLPRWTVPRLPGHVHPVPSYPFVPSSIGTFLPFCPRNPFPFDPGTSPGSAPFLIHTWIVLGSTWG